MTGTALHRDGVVSRVQRVAYENGDRAESQVVKAMERRRVR